MTQNLLHAVRTRIDWAAQEPDMLRRVSVAMSIGVLTFLFTIHLVPHLWTGNEVNYFDLAHRWVNPDAFGDAYAVNDASIARMVSFIVIGFGIQSLGMESAFAFFGFCFLIVSPLAYIYLLRSLRIDLLSSALALILFFALDQSLVGHASIFGTVEPKSFAYILVIFGLGLAMTERRITAIILCAAAVYFHILVGGFWGAAVLGLFVLKDGAVRKSLPLLGIFVGLTSPLILAIASARIGVLPGSSEIDLNVVYAVFRNPHHIAPFADSGVFFATWLPGFVLHGLLAAGIGLSAYWSRLDNRSFAIWVAGLNAYVVLAGIIAFLDRETHVLAMFYMFRPSALILLLSMLWVSKHLLSPTRSYLRYLAVAAAAIWMGMHAAVFSYAATFLIRGHLPLASMLTPAESDLVEWVGTQTPTGSVIVIQPLSGDRFLGEGSGVWSGMERLLNRPTLVNYKFVPTDKPNMLKWYQLLQWRDAVFAGDCSSIDAYSVDYLIIREAANEPSLAACTDLVWRSGELAVLQVNVAKAAGT